MEDEEGNEDTDTAARHDIDHVMVVVLQTSKRYPGSRGEEKDAEEEPNREQPVGGVRARSVVPSVKSVRFTKY